MQISNLKFRVWDDEDKKIYYVAKLDMWGCEDSWTMDTIDETGDIQFFDIPVPMEGLMQFTGFRDNKINDIYEGDIVVFEDVVDAENGYSEQSCIGIVQWDEETASFDITNRLNAKAYEVLEGECLVVGNVYENKELVRCREDERD